MKPALILVGLLAISYSVFATFGFVRTVRTNEFSADSGLTEIAASALPVCIGLIVSIICFQKVRR